MFEKMISRNSVWLFCRGLARRRAQVLSFALAMLALPGHAEPLTNRPTQPDNKLIDASQWLPDAPNAPVVPSAPGNPREAVAPTNATGAPPGATKIPPEPLRLPQPPVSNLPKAPADPAAAPPRSEAPGAEIRAAVKEVVRPLVDELNQSDAAQALRGLQSVTQMGREPTLNDADKSLESRAEGSGPTSNPTVWEGQAAQQAAPPTAAQVQRDKVLASVMLEQLVDELTPWAIGLVVLYGLFYLVRLVWAYNRHRTNRRRLRSQRRSQRHGHRSHRSGANTGTEGTPGNTRTGTEGHSTSL